MAALVGRTARRGPRIGHAIFPSDGEACFGKQSAARACDHDAHVLRRGNGQTGIAIVTSNVIPLPAGPHWRVLIAHRRHEVRDVLRTLIEGETVAVVDADDAESALAALDRARFDLLILELDLPLKDGVSVMQIHRMLLAHERIPVEAPAVILTLAAEVRGVTTLTDHLRTLGVAGFIDDAPRADAAALVEEILRARAADRVAGKPAAA